MRRFAMLWGLDEQARREQVLAVVETYYPYNCFVDESIQDRYGPKATCVSAYLATFEAWLQFEQEWRGILRHFEIPLDGKQGHDQPFMHMTDFIAGKRQFQNDWSHQKRDEFMERLTMTISEHTIVGVSVSVMDEEFERVLPADARGFWREPYFFCLWGMLTTFIGFEEHYLGMVLPKPIWFLFDPRQKAKQFASQIFYGVKSLHSDRDVFGQMGFGEMWKTPQIQAADVLVYESARRRVELRNNPSATMRPSLAKLLRKQRVSMRELNEESLRKYMEFVNRADAQEPED